MRNALFYTYIIVLCFYTIKLNAQSDAILSTEQAAYDVLHYDLDLTIDPSTKSIKGSLLCQAEILNKIDVFILDLDRSFNVDSVLFKENDDDYSKIDFEHTRNVLEISIPTEVSLNDLVSVKVFYHGKPKVSRMPPWDSGFVWSQTPTGDPWLGVVCEDQGADIWWPCKDHPSDEPNSMSLSFTVPNPLTCVSNGKFLGKVINDNNTTTYNWFVSTPINNYNVTFYAAEYTVIEDDYNSSIGNTIPFYFWVLPQDYNDAIKLMDKFKKEFEFVEALCGPFPFGMDKQGWVQAPYAGMEHQTIIAYGSNFFLNPYSFNHIHLHELAHEWWGNLISAKNWSDLWIHEGMATYIEALYIDQFEGRKNYLHYMQGRRPADDHIYPLAPREQLTAWEAFEHLNPYIRGAAVMHTLRYHIGDELFFKILKRWAYAVPNDFDNTNGRLCRLVSTDDLKDQAEEEETGLELDPFFEVFFREAKYPNLKLIRTPTYTKFLWETENNIKLDVNIPVLIDGLEQTVEVVDGHGVLNVLLENKIEIDPDKWILMGEPIITEEIPILIGISDNNDLNYSLKQNYPNPFKLSTTIEFTIPEYQNVSIKVYNIHGVEQATLINKKLHPGPHQISLNASHLTSGTYFYCFKAGNYSKTRKLIVL